VVHTHQLHVSAGILAIFRLYSTYKAPTQYTIYVEIAVPILRLIEVPPVNNKLLNSTCHPPHPHSAITHSYKLPNHTNWPHTQGDRGLEINTTALATTTPWHITQRERRKNYPSATQDSDTITLWYKESLDKAPSVDIVQQM